MNNENSNNPFASWRSQHPSTTLDAETERRIQQWVRVSHDLLGLFDQFDSDIEPWVQGRKSPLPDLVGFVAGYGYSRTVTGDWKDLPIDIPADEVENWEKNSSLIGSLEQLYDYQAGVAGSVAEILHTRSKEFVSLVNKQLTTLYDELGVLVARSLTDFTPTQWSNEDMGEQEVGQEIDELDRIFDVFEKLWCFEQGIEELRMLVITEDDPEFHLPSQAFYDALKSIDSQKLLSNLEHAKPKLEAILKSWANTRMTYSGKPYHRPGDRNAPNAFWWRHPKTRVQRSSSNNRKPQGNRRPPKSRR